ncbi:MAG: hypothetical protein ACKO8G_06655 [Actinomycetota bacterium]
MNLSARERRLILIAAVVVLLIGAYWVFFRGDSGSEVPDLFPDAVPTPEVFVLSPTPAPTFTVPPDARDPFSS